jgi:hypothetical protein
VPLYLDLSLALAREAATTADGALAPAIFGGPLPNLVTSVFEDLPDVERDVARAASLLPRFEPGLVSQAARAHLGDALRFCRKSLVTRDDHPLFPFRLHDAVRSAIADEPVTSPGAWAAADRAVCAGRLAEALHTRHEQLTDIEQRREVLGLTAGLCTAHDLRLHWLITALTELPGMALTAARLPPPAGDTWIGQLAGFFQAWQDRNLDERIDYFSNFIEVPHEEDIDAVAHRWLAYCLRSKRGRGEEALVILRDLLSRSPESELLRYQVARTLRGIGRYSELAEHLRRFPLGNLTADARIRSDLAYDRGDIAEATAGAAARASYLHATSQHRIAMENDGVALWRAALVRRASVADCDALIGEADRHGMRSIMRTALATKIVCLHGDDSAARDSFAEMAAVIRELAGKPGWRDWAAAIIHGLYRGNVESIQAVRPQWEEVRVWSPNNQFIDRLFVFAGYPSAFPSLSIGTEDHRQIERRWQTVIAALIEPERH